MRGCERHYLTCQDENCERAYCVDRRSQPPAPTQEPVAESREQRHVEGDISSGATGVEPLSLDVIARKVVFDAARFHVDFATTAKALKISEQTLWDKLRQGIEELRAENAELLRQRLANQQRIIRREDQLDNEIRDHAQALTRAEAAEKALHQEQQDHKVTESMLSQTKARLAEVERERDLYLDRIKNLCKQVGLAEIERDRARNAAAEMAKLLEEILGIVPRYPHGPGSPYADYRIYDATRYDIRATLEAWRAKGGE